MDERNAKLLTIASHGYQENGVGSEIGMGEGLIGMVARAGGRSIYRPWITACDTPEPCGTAPKPWERRKPLRVKFRSRVCRTQPEIAVPLVTRGRLVGVLAIKARIRSPFSPAKTRC